VVRAEDRSCEASVTFALILIPTACYSLAALIYATQKNWPLAITYSGYAWANCGLLWLDRLMAK
jgi:hypothetical protein